MRCPTAQRRSCSRRSARSTCAATSASTVLTLRGATALHFKRLTSAGDAHVVLSFSGVGSTLERERSVGQPALAGIAITSGGTPKNPTTTIDFDAAPGSVHALAPSGLSERADARVRAGRRRAARIARSPRAATRAWQRRRLPQPSSRRPRSLRPRNARREPNRLRPPTARRAGASHGGDEHADERRRLRRSRARSPATSATNGIACPTIAGTSISNRRRWRSRRTMSRCKDDTVIALRVKGFVGPHDALPTVRIAFTLALAPRRQSAREPRRRDDRDRPRRRCESRSASATASSLNGRAGRRGRDPGAAAARRRRPSPFRPARGNSRRRRRRVRA